MKFRRRRKPRRQRQRFEQRAHFRPLRIEKLESRWVLSEVAPIFTKTFSPDTIGPGSTTTLTFTIDNTGNGLHGEDMLAFSDTLPAGVTIADPANAVSNCGGTLTAPDGGGTITFSDGQVGLAESCTISVDVTSSTAGTHRNVSGDLTSSAGNSGTATDDLTVDTTLPGFTKSFSPSTVPLGGRSTLTFTIDNTTNASNVLNLDFTDNLPTGIVIANPSNASTTCGTATIPPTLTADAGTSAVVLDSNGTAGFPAVAAGATCTVTVDIIATASGELDNVSNELLANFISAGKASDTLDVSVTTIAIQKDFVNDPVPPGGTVQLDFTINNFDRNFSATDVGFSDDLAAALTGLTFGSLLSNDCGGSVSGVGTTDILLTGGTVSPEGSCSISASLSVPAGAIPGTYTNTTGAITATIDGSPVVGNMASEELFVEPVPLLTKEFLEVGTLAPDPVINAGDDVVLRFTVTNTSMTSMATDIAFIDELTDGGPFTGFLPFPVTVTLPPVPDPPCGAGSSLALVSVGTDRQGLELTGGSLAAAPGAGDSCTFDVTLTTPDGLGPGLYLNTTEEITATVDDDTRTGDPASDTLTVIAAPSLTKAFTDDPVAPGGMATLEFTLSYPDEATGDATEITFTDDLTALTPPLAGLSATGLPLVLACDPDGPGGNPGTGTLTESSGVLTFADGTLSPGESCTFGVTLDVPAAADSGSYSNSTSAVSATVEGLAATSAAASDDLSISGLTFTKQFLDDPVIAGDTTMLRFTIDNMHPTDDATITFFTDNLQAELTGLAATGPPTADTCGGDLSGTTFLIYTGGSVMSGQSCTIDVDVLVPVAAADGTYQNVTSSLAATQGVAITVSPATDNLTVNSNLLQLTKEFTDDPVAPGGTVTLEFTLTNLDSGQAASDIDFTDDLDAALSGLTFDSIVSNDCGATVTGQTSTTITVDGASLSAGGTCTVQTSLTVPAGAPEGAFTNTTSGLTGMIGGFAVTGDPASDDLVIPVVSGDRDEDFGDAATGGPIGAPPDSYPTLAAQDGARHAVVAGAPTLGPTIDIDVDGQPDATATGDDNDFEGDDEDGVTFTQATYVVNGLGSTGMVDVELQNADPTQNLLNAWIDFNRDGDWADAGEQIFTDFDLGTTNGVQSLVFPIGPVAEAVASGTTFARFRLDTFGGISYIGPAPDGEVEDHTLMICSTHVTNTNDSGGGSFRDAINCANSVSGTDTITFDIPGASHTITPLSALPTITDAVIIDGTTEPDFVGTPVVELDGSSAGVGDGLHITAGPSTVHSLVVNRWRETGIFLASGSDGSRVEGSFIGTDVAGTAALPNDIGVKINQSSNNTIGTGAAGNVISGNTNAGVRISSASATGNDIWNNLIGTDVTGNAALGNSVGVEIATSQGNTIGGTSGSQGNIISGNADEGISLRGSNNTFVGNRIGTNQAGTAALPNEDGIRISGNTSGNTIGGTSAADGNQISGNSNAGVKIEGTNATGNFVQGNLIGTDAAGTGPLGNKNGVEIDNAPTNTIGGAAAGAGNVISGNRKNGVLLRDGADGNVVQENLIGLNSAGTAALGNSRGVLIDDATNNQIGGSGNIISGSTAEGVRIQDAGSTGNTLRDNFIGTNQAGTSALANNIGVRIRNGATGNIIGGDSTAGEGNVISASTLEGVSIRNADGNTIFGNLVGTDAAGSGALGNGRDGVEIKNSENNMIGGTGTGEGNVISGNVRFGVHLVSDNNTVEGNRIGTNQAGTGALANDTGVYLDGTGNTIGGDSTNGEGNQISGNTDAGVQLDGAGTTGNMVEGNSIGLDAAGTGSLANRYGVYITGAQNNTIGGDSTAGEGNTISGNTLHGVYLSGVGSTGNIVSGNQIGTNVAGTGAAANLAQGVLIEDASGNTIGGTAAGAGNLISGNTLDGVKIIDPGATGNTLQGNTIGEDLGGNPIPNRGGVVIGDSASDNVIGGAAAGAANVIADNAQRGVWINANAGTGNTVSRNSIHDNGGTLRVGIDLSGSGATANDPSDPDFGPNNTQNTPVIQSAVFGGPIVTMMFLVDSTTANSVYDLTVEFYLADSDSQEGETFLDQVTYAAADATNVVTVNIASNSPNGASIGSEIVATATDNNGNTSEFSAPFTVTGTLLAAGGAVENSSADSLTDGELTDIVSAATQRLGAVLGEDFYSNVSVAIADLPGAMLGEATTHSITIDINAAGHGWYVDPTPLDDTDDSNSQSMDLLTVVMHELGHVAGLDDLDDTSAEDDLMFGWLESGTRKSSLETSFADEAFASF